MKTKTAKPTIYNGKKAEKPMACELDQSPAGQFKLEAAVISLLDYILSVEEKRD